MSLLVEELLKKAIESCNYEHSLLNKKFDELSVQANELQKSKEKYVQELQYICKHPETRRVNGAYLPGGYDHVSEEYYTIECANCGKVLESKCIRGSYA